VLAELNFARTHPQDYARQLERLARTGGVNGRYADPVEDAGALDEAIDYLERQLPLPPLSPDARLASAARAHVMDQGRTGETGHGRDGHSFSQRLKQAGLYAGLSAEDISYGFDQPAEVVRQLIIDQGVPGRGHRANIFQPALRIAGVACGSHPAYGALCVIDFASQPVGR
jgi:uncharacterized protein YkwD